ncbi:OB-fold protein [Fontibacter flavus]|uniref:tRNA_anti-like n=1 Tax=Fontibacter flavus TaxID=654838 RepID=A0ABV6FWU6_9BACT
MKTKRTIKILVIIAVAGIIVAGVVGFYMFNMPHRDVQTAKTDITISSSLLTEEFLQNPNSANDKYLDEDGDSKILEVSGTVDRIETDYNDNIVILLKEPGNKVGVSCTFLSSVKSTASQIKVGQSVKVKGVIRSGAFYDEDLRMYEDVIMEKCDLVSKI